MVNVTAATSFFGSRQEGMWPAGDTRRVSAHRANELIEEGLAIEARDQSEEAVTPPPSAQPAGFAAEPLPAVTLEGMKEEKGKGKTKEDKAKPETKEAK